MMKIVSTISILTVFLFIFVIVQPTYPLPERVIVVVDYKSLLDSMRKKNMVTLFEIKDVISTKYQLKAKK